MTFLLLSSLAFMNGCRCITGAFVVDYKTSRVEALQELIGKGFSRNLSLTQSITFSFTYSITSSITHSITSAVLALPALSCPLPTTLF